jgi:hypothetical protein
VQPSVRRGLYGVDMVSLTPPRFREERFNCAHCGALSHHDWVSLDWPREDDGNLIGVMNRLTKLRDQLTASLCLSCERIAVWHRLEVPSYVLNSPRGSRVVEGGPSRMIWPNSDGSVEPLADEAPDFVRELWDEARQVAALSPRSAAALLRLALQLLLDHLQPGHKTIDAAIAAAYANDTPGGIVMAMDYVRVTGNGAVHDGQVQMDEDPEVVPALFELLRYIVDDTLVKMAKANRLHASLPADKLAGIAQRNARAKP